MEDNKILKKIKKLKNVKSFEYWLESEDNNLYTFYVEDSPEVLKSYYYGFLSEIERDFIFTDFFNKDYFRLFLDYLFVNKIIKYSYHLEFFRDNLGKVIFSNVFEGYKTKKINLLILKPILDKIIEKYPEKFI